MIIALAGMLFESARAHWFAAPPVDSGCPLLISGINNLASDVPTVGRSATFHTLLGGISEIGHFEGVKWEDSAIHSCILACHDVDLYTPEFNGAVEFERHPQSVISAMASALPNSTDSRRSNFTYDDLSLLLRQWIVKNK